MHRFVLTDAQWAKMEPLCLGKPTDPGRTGGADVRQLEYGVQALSRLDPGRRFQTDF